MVAGRNGRQVGPGRRRLCSLGRVEPHERALQRGRRTSQVELDKPSGGITLATLFFEAKRRGNGGAQPKRSGAVPETSRPKRAETPPIQATRQGEGPEHPPDQHCNTEADLKHRFLVIFEAAGMMGEFASYLIRSLLSEGRIIYDVVERTASGLKPRRIEKDGPTGLLVTTTAVRLHPENETRLLSLHVTGACDPKRK